MIKAYSGIRKNKDTYVYVNGTPLSSDHHEAHKCNFEWSYQGHGPRHLAYAILLDCFNDKLLAQTYMTKFSMDVVGRFNQDKWSIDSNQVKEIITAYQSETKH